MWRTVYLSKLPGLDKKVRVAFDWTLDLLFPKDVCAVYDFDHHGGNSSSPGRGKDTAKEYRRLPIPYARTSVLEWGQWLNDKQAVVSRDVGGSNFDE